MGLDERPILIRSKARSETTDGGVALQQEDAANALLVGYPSVVMLLASDKNTASGANFRVKKDLRKGLRAQQATKQGDPWMDGAQDYPDLQVSDEAPTPDIASPDQKYDDPIAPPVWLAHKDLEPPGLPQTPPPPPPEMPPPMYEAT